MMSDWKDVINRGGILCVTLILAETISPLNVSFPPATARTQYIFFFKSSTHQVFVYMVSFFRELLLHTDANRLNSAKIAVVCCNCMVKTSPDDGEARELQGKHSLQLVINHLLTTGMI